MPDELILDNLTKRFPNPDGTERAILDAVSHRVAPGETLAIVGPSGSGKSTLLNIIGSLEPPTSGTVRLGDLDVCALSGKALAQYRATRTGFVFQDHHLLPQLTTLENVLLPTLAANRAGGAANGGDGAAQRARELLETVGLSARRDAFPAQMSGGERQRVAIARALINGAQLLLCDEPTGNLDRQTGAAVIDLLLDLARGQGVTVLMVTHNPGHAGRFASCFELRDGKLAPLAPPASGSG